MSNFFSSARTGLCHQYEEIRSLLDQQGLIFRNANKHRPRRDLPNGLADCEILGFGRQVHSSISCKNVAVIVGPYGLSGTICSQRLDQDVPF